MKKQETDGKNYPWSVGSNGAVIGGSYTIPIYDISFFLYIHDTYKDFRELFPGIPEHALGDVLPENTVSGCWISNDVDPFRNTHVLCLHPNASEGIIAHECCHIAEFVMDHIKEAPCYHSEPKLYLLCWLVDFVTEEMKKLRKHHD